MADEFAEDAPVEAPPRRRLGMVTALVVVVVFAAFGGGLWYTYKEGVRRGSESVAPVIAADHGPVKVRPQSPGGMDVPYRDTLVYDKLSPGPVKEAEAKLRPPPEEPIITRRPKPRPGAEDAGPAPPTALPPIMTRPKVAAPAVPADAPQPPAEAAAPPQTAARTATTPAPDVPPSPAARYRLQLASMRSAAAAAETWDALSAKHGDVIGALELVIQKIDLGEGKGLYYRVQAGPVTTEADGERMCAALRQRKVACIVVRR